MGKYIHKFNTQADFESFYYDEPSGDVITIGLPSFGPYNGASNGIEYYNYIGTESGAKGTPKKDHMWSNGSGVYYTLERNPSVGGNVYSNSSSSIPEPSPFPGVDFKICEIKLEHESNYKEPWLSYTEGEGLDYNKQPILREK